MRNDVVTDSQPNRRGRSARIGAPGGMLVLPASTPYEWQLLCEHAGAAARQHGRVRLRVAGTECIVRSAMTGAAGTCGGCARRLAGMTFRLAWRDLCRDCARLWLTREQPESLLERQAVSGS